MIPRPNSKAVRRRERLNLPAVEPPRRPARERVADFAETYVPVTPEWARAAARRCIQCPSAPCVRACPLGNDIPYALWHLEHGLVDDAARIFRRTSAMPAICGRVCPQTELCEGACPYMKQGRPPVPIGRLEAFAADWAERQSLADDVPAPRATGKAVAIVGAGPAGLAAAEALARRGHEVTVLDAWPAGGGLLRYGIPRFKLDPGHARKRTDWLTRLGVRFETGVRVGRDASLHGLLDRGFQAIFLAIGAGVPRPFEVEGADLGGVLGATPFLVGANSDPEVLPAGMRDRPEVGRRVAVVGGGDTAMDCVRTALRLGAEEAVCWYRRSEAEMPGNARDRALAREEGARFEWLSLPLRLHGDSAGRVRAMTVASTTLGEPDASGRRRPAVVPGSERMVDVDTVIHALGYLPDRSFVARIAGLEAEPDGRIRVDPATGATSRPGIYAGGDAVLGPALVVDAVAHGRRAAEAIHDFLAAGRSVAA
jgi:glutamate synthase (NADPH) small chain